MYKTVEARFENNKILFDENFNIPKKSRKVLVTFLDTSELESCIEPLIWSQEVLLTKDHDDFISLLKKA